jgi:hypothetical protein
LIDLFKNRLENQSLRQWIGPVAFLLAVAFAWSVIGLKTWGRMERIQTATATSRFAPPVFDATSPTGYKGGLRTVILPMGSDGYHWIMAAQRMAAGDGWRTRWSPDDNAPDGRPMHWSQPLIWWMVALGAIASRFNGLPLGACIEQCAVWSTVPIHLLLVLVLPLSVRRPFGWGAAALLAAAMGAVYRFASLFFAGAPDHHGFVTAALMGCVLFLAAALVDAKAGKWPIAAGAAAGIALWISAATAVPVLVLLQIGVALAILIWGKNLPNPRIWRLWGMSAAIASLGLYLLEYFPDAMQMRLEVNHPLYALEMLGAGGLLYQIALWRTSGWRAVNPRTFLPALAACLVLPAAFLLGGRDVFVVRDSFLWQLHKDYIHEFRDLAGWMSIQHPEALFVSVTPLFLVGPLALWLISRRDLAFPWRAALLIIATPAAGMFVLGVMQIRWMNMAESLGMALLTVTAAVFFGRGGAIRIVPPVRWVCAAFCLLALIQMPQRMVRDFVAEWPGRRPSLMGDEISVICAREIAYRLRALGGREAPVVAAGPSTTTWMLYFGGLKGLGTLYWENLEGLLSAAELYASTSDEKARELVIRHRISYIVFLWMEPFAAEYPRLLQGLPPGKPLPDTLAAGLIGATRVPPWAHAISMPVPGEIPNSWARVYDVRAATRR